MNYQDNPSTISCKVVILGESGVGKTSIIARYSKNIFDSDSLPTIGASFVTKVANFVDFEKNIKFDVNGS